jgi:hypothetical protein
MAIGWAIAGLATVFGPAMLQFNAGTTIKDITGAQVATDMGHILEPGKGLAFLKDTFVNKAKLAITWRDRAFRNNKGVEDKWQILGSFASQVGTSLGIGTMVALPMLGLSAIPAIGALPFVGPLVAATVATATMGTMLWKSLHTTKLQMLYEAKRQVENPLSDQINNPVLNSIAEAYNQGDMSNESLMRTATTNSVEELAKKVDPKEAYLQRIIEATKDERLKGGLGPLNPIIDDFIFPTITKTLKIIAAA